jgi:outer membrane translocation and assembly module TamA
VDRLLFLGCLLLFLIPGLPFRADAQPAEPQTRAEALRQEREKKQQSLTANEPDGLQRGMDYVEDRALYLLTREGWYPKIGSLTTGSGFAFGPGYRDRDLLRRRGVIELWAAGSLKKYWATQARVAVPEQTDGPFMFEATANLREYPNESFFGLGPDSLRNDGDFLLRTRDVGARAGIRVAPALMIGAGTALFSARWAAENDDEDDAAAFIDVASAPANVDYVRSHAFVEVDYREPLNARRGGWYRLDFSHFGDREGGLWSFHRTDLDVRQFIGMFADRRVIALRGWISSVQGEDSSVGVPFYLLPTLGGNDSLRGFRNYRFRGPHAMLLQAEYRWEVWSGLDAALFYDAGKVALRRADLNFSDLERDYGFGFRFNTAAGVIMRVDAAFGSRDGKHLHIVFGGVF